MRITRLVQRRSGVILMQNYKMIKLGQRKQNVTLYQWTDQGSNPVAPLDHWRGIIFVYILLIYLKELIGRELTSNDESVEF